jgi:NAD(P)-dependent dehydrogenase (short-subunit alcohol dehydrogenase family)
MKPIRYMSRWLVTAIIVSLITLSAHTVSAPVLGQTADAPTVLITGSNRGIGFAFTQAYADKGWNVIATCRTPSSADDLNALAAEHDNVVVEELDVTDFNEIDDLAKKYKDTPIDVLLNNAALLVGATNPPTMKQIRFGTIDYQLLEDMYKVNSIGPLKVSEAFLSHVEASDQKKIVVMSSIGGSIGSVNEPGSTQYRSSKAAANMTMRIMSFEVADRGISVGIIHPGIVDTRGLLDADPETLPERLRESLPWMRNYLLRPSESVALILPIIDGLNMENTGTFYQVKGEPLPW